MRKLLFIKEYCTPEGVTEPTGDLLSLTSSVSLLLGRSIGGPTLL